MPWCWESRWVTLSCLPRDMMLFVPYQPSRRRNLCQGSADKSNKLPLKDVKRYIKTCGLLVGHWGNCPGVWLAVKGTFPGPDDRTQDTNVQSWLPGPRPHSANFSPFSNQQIAITSTTSHPHPICLPRCFLKRHWVIWGYYGLYTMAVKRNLGLEVLKIWPVILISKEWSQRNGN